MSRAGDSIEDYCRACKLDRMHTVIAADPNGVPIRVACGYCSSEHNYRGGPRMDVGGGQQAPAGPSGLSAGFGAGTGGPAEAGRYPAGAAAKPPRSGREPFPIVSDRERIAPPMTASAAQADLEMLLRRVIREEGGVTPAVPAERWRGGTLVLRPGNATQEKTWPIETFFHKIVMIRNRLRTLEQQINGMDLPADVKIRLQGYISASYGSLTSFNVLFADEADQFKGSSGD
ncbi:MAG TPA: hypothetical protein VFJ02_14595 [Vicinamibacterales bacterium]|nr:hypothetical protein [Vicinamibacterales bacterium]